MASGFREVMAKKSDDGLLDYIDNYNKYTPEAIAAAVDELKTRGINFSEQQWREITQKIEARIKAENEEHSLWDDNFLKASVVTDPDAPLLYSKRAIMGFSALLATVFGAVLLSSNINDTKKKWIVVGFGIIYTALTMLIANIIPANTFYVLLLNTAGGLGLTTTFWDKYVGKETKYRPKPILKPLIISIAITILLVLAFIYD